MNNDYNSNKEKEFSDERSKVYKPLPDEIDPEVQEEIEEALMESKETKEIQKSPWRN